MPHPATFWTSAYSTPIRFARRHAARSLKDSSVPCANVQRVAASSHFAQGYTTSSTSTPASNSGFGSSSSTRPPFQSRPSQSLRPQTPEGWDQRCVQLTNIPMSALPLDIRRMAPNPKVARALLDVKILRVQRLHPAGKAVLIFNSALEARQYHAACVGRILGGQSVNSSILNTTEASEIIRAHRQPGLGIAMDLAHSEAGRVVILRGLPAMLTEGRLHAMLARAYDLAPLNQFRAAQIKGLSSSASPEWNERDEDGHRRTHTRGKMIGPIYKLPEGNIPSNRSSFLVRLTNQTDAHRLVRRWHMTFFDPEETDKRYIINASVMF